MKKIGHVLYSRRGGAGIAASLMCDLLSKNGKNEHVILDFDDLNILGKKVSFIKKFFFKFYFLFSNSLLIFFKNRRSKTLNILPTFLYKNMHKDYDCLFIHWVGGGVMSLYDIYTIKIPVIIVLHDFWFISPTLHVDNSELQKQNCSLFDELMLIRKRFFLQKRKESTTFVAPSDFVYKKFINSYVGYNLNVVKIPHYLDDKFWANTLLSKNNNKSISFFTTSRSQYKGSKLFADAIYYLQNELDFNFQINIIGNYDPSLFSKLKNVNLIGFTTRHDLRKIYSDSLLCVFPSKIETFGQMPIECSLSGGTPVIYKYVATAEFLPCGINSFHFKKYTSFSLASTILYSIKNRNLLARFNQDCDYIINSYDKLLEDVLN